MDTNIPDIYKPIIRNDIKIDGISGQTTTGGSEIELIRKSFIFSYDKDFERVSNGILNVVLGISQNETLNRLIVVIKKDNRAIIYHDFPVKLSVRLKKPKEALTAVFAHEIMDIEGIHFSDAVFDLDIQSGDKFLWLFRVNWKFGLFFDFSQKLETDKLHGELARCYKYLVYLDTYSFLEKQGSFNELIEEGWFPFIQLTGIHFQQLIDYYADDKKFMFQIEKILAYFNQDKISELHSYWWNNSIFSEKREIIEAGTEAYFQGTKSGYINAIKTLSTEVEGILRLAYFREFHKKPTFEEIKQYITNRGEKRFSSSGSLIFPELFYEYLDHSIFKNFDLKSGEIPASRHSYAHGVAGSDKYDQIRAFQLILTLDQIYFFLG